MARLIRNRQKERLCGIWGFDGSKIEEHGTSSVLKIVRGHYPHRTFDEQIAGESSPKLPPFSPFPSSLPPFRPMGELATAPSWCQARVSGGNPTGGDGLMAEV